MLMKKLVTLILVLAGIVNTASADNIRGSWDSWTNHEVSYSNGVGTFTVSLAASTTYQFGIDNGKWWKNGSTMTSTNCVGWEFDSGDGTASITTTIAGEYTFKVVWIEKTTNNWVPRITVLYPVAKQYTIHFNNADSWGSVNVHRWIYQVANGNSFDLTTWPGVSVPANSNNADYYDLTIQDSYNYFIFNNGGRSQTGDIPVDYDYVETWVIKDGGYFTLTTEAPSGWIGYKRSVTSGNFGTICLPFDATVTGATIYEITSAVKNGSGELTAINLTETSSLTGGVAYIFKATSSELVATYSGAYKEATAGNHMMGNLSADNLTVPQGMYVVGGNEIHKVTGDGVTVGQNRGYLNLSDLETTSARGLNFISLEGETTGIDAVKQEVKANKVFFNLAGQRVSQPAKGLYIVNGKKVIMK